MFKSIYLILIPLALALNFYKMVQFSVISGSDFEQDYMAASNLLNGASIYQGVNAHPPFNALIFSPLTFLPSNVAFILLGGVTLTLVWLCALMIVKGLKLKEANTYAIFLCSLLWPPTMAVVCLGQSSVLWGGAVTAAWFYEKKDRHVVAGIFIGLAILIKLIPALIVVVWLLNKRWRAALTAATVVLGGFLLMAGLIGFDEIRYFFFTRLPDNAHIWVDFYDNASISGAAEKLFGSDGGWSRSLAELPVFSKGIAVFGSAALIMVTMVISCQVPPQQIKGFDDYRTALVIVAMLLVSPLTWPHYFLVLLLPLTLLLSSSENDSITIQGKTWVLISIMLLLLPMLIEQMSGQGAQFWVHTPVVIQLITISQTIGLFMLWIQFAKRIMLVHYDKNSPRLMV